MTADEYKWYVMDETGALFSVDSARLIRLSREGGVDAVEEAIERGDWWELDDVLYNTDAYPLPMEE
jgi:hypothetical protein